MLLFVTDRKTVHASLIDALIGHGIFLHVATSDTAEHVCEARDTGGVLLDCVGSLRTGEQLCARLREKYPSMPIAAWVAERAIPNMPVNYLLRDSDEASVLADVLEFCFCVCGFQETPLSTHTLEIGCDPASTHYMGYTLALSPREHRILRCLLYRYPRPTSPDELLSLCYPEGVQVSANLSVQISRINAAAAAIDPRPLVVFLPREGGYRLRDGIL